MARHRDRVRRRKSRGLFGRFAREVSEFELEPETRKNVIALLFFIVGIVSILSLFHSAGRIGVWIYPRLFWLFGWGGYLLPFAVTAASLARLDPGRFPFSRGRYVGLLFLLLSSLGILHLLAPWREGLSLSDQGRGGGLIGLFVTYWLRQGVGEIAAWAVLLAVLLASLMMVTNWTPGQLLTTLRERRARVDEEDEEEPAVDVDEEDGVEPDAGAEETETGAQRTLPVFATRLLDSVKREREQAVGVREAAPRHPAGPPYERPSLALLSNATTKPAGGDVAEMQQSIEKTLKTFDIPVTMKEVHVGPTVTQYTLKPEEGVKLTKITTLHNDLALALSAHPIRIEAPIPGKSLVGIEVPNKAVSIVRLREVLESEVFRRGPSPLTFAVGKDVTGQAVVADLQRMPHLLIAGATGSGKSVMINNIIMSVLYRNSPAVAQLLIIDPKRVELALYNGIPHLLAPVVTEPEKAINALRWAVGEMDRRYSLLSETRKRDVVSYNTGRRGRDLLPYVIIIIDELADIMARYGREVEGAIVRLAQMARAVGLHLVVATQRPSVDIITGLIKANITARIAFNVASSVDARTILDSAGAEKLLGNGDMLFLRGDISKPRRIQSAYISEEEVKRVVRFLVERSGEVAYDTAITATRQAIAGLEARGTGAELEEDVDDGLLEEAERVVREAGRASTSLLQRRLRIGYSRAARILDILQERGIVGPPDGSRPREVLVRDEPSGFPGRSAASREFVRPKDDVSPVQDEAARAEGDRRHFEDVDDPEEPEEFSPYERP